MRYREFQEQGLELANFYSHPDRWTVIAVLDHENLWRVTYNEDGEIQAARNR